MAVIKDSGNRTEFASGAVRDIQEGKGRCDLLPIPEVIEFLSYAGKVEQDPLFLIGEFERTGDRFHLIAAALSFSETEFSDPYTAIMEYAKHLEDGCKKYGERNWELGLPLHRYTDSGIRHYLKHKRGDTDERHDRAFLWNMLCGAATCRMHPEMNTFPINDSIDKK